MTLPEAPPTTLDGLTEALSYLFEPTPILLSQLVPQVHDAGSASTYSALIDLCALQVDRWSYADKALFLSGHPAIGETKNLSSSSSAEQGNSGATPQIVLDRLAHLNKLYEEKFPSLRFLIFVNGRSRQEIVTLLETYLGLANLPVPLTEGSRSQVTFPESVSNPIPIESELWKAEADRGVADVWKIARDRISKLCLQ